MGTALAVQHTTYELFLGPRDEAASCARMALKAKLPEWRMSALFDDASIVVCELVTNAARLGEIFTLMLFIARGRRSGSRSPTASAEPP